MTVTACPADGALPQNNVAAQPCDEQAQVVPAYQIRDVLVMCIVTALYAAGVGCTVGLIPEVMTDRYARLEYDYEDDKPTCDKFDHKNMPVPCQQGADHAQASAALANVAMSLLALLCNPIVGRWSDVWCGRKPFLLSSLLIGNLVPAIVLWNLIVITPAHSSPAWYYGSFVLTGAINYLGVTFSILADIVPPTQRTAANGLMLAGMYGGFSLAPSFALILTPAYLASLSVLLLSLASAVAAVVHRETLNEAVREENRQKIAQEVELESQGQISAHRSNSTQTSLITAVGQPLREMAILWRDRLRFVVATGMLVSAMVFASDASLLLYYLEDDLNVRAHDLASLFWVLGIMGIIMQAGALQWLLPFVSEQRLLVATFASGTLHNLLYGLARTATPIYLAFALSQFTKLNTPIMSALVSKDATNRVVSRAPCLQ